MRYAVAVRIAAAATSAVALAAVPAPAAAQDACPNAQFRTGKQAQLPDCRAYEQVTPVDKNGVAAAPFIGGYSSLDGNRLFSFATGGAVATDSGFQFRGLSSTRTGDWSTAPTDAPQTPTTFFATVGTYLYSDDGTKVLTASASALTPDAIAGNSNLYVRDLTRPNAYTLAASLPGGEFLDGLIQARVGLLDATPDLSTILITGGRSVDPERSPNDERYLYRIGGGKVDVASRLPGGAPAQAQAQVQADDAHLLSDDGRTVTWKTADTLRAYRSTAGGDAVELTRPEIATPQEYNVGPNTFSTPDGNSTVFVSSGALTADSSPGSVAIYRKAGDELTDLTAPFTRGGTGQTVELRGVSPDGEIVWFTANTLTGADSPDDPGPFDGAARLFVLDTRRGTLDRVAKFDPTLEDFGPTAYRFSPDGRRVAFRSLAPLTGQDNENPACPNQRTPDRPACAQVFTYDARTPEQPLVCASCEAGPATAAAGLAQENLESAQRPTRAITDDGRVFFDTAARLGRGDVDTTTDVYQYTAGVGPQLLTLGDGGRAATFLDASGDGSSVFVNVTEPLVEQDTDDLPDAYVVRTGGGIASQRVAPSPTTPCRGAGCRPAPGPQPSRPDQGTRTLAPPASTTVPRFSVRRPSARALRAAARRGRLTVAVKVTAPGTIATSLRGRVGGRRQRTVATDALRATRAQTVRLTLRLSKRARATLRRTGRLTLTLTVRYSERLAVSRTTLTIKKGGSR